MIDGLTCWEQLGALIAREWQDPDLLALHFLTVASYNLQHPAQFTDDALASLRTAYLDHLDRGVPVAEIRRQMAPRFAGQARVLKDPAARQPLLRPWLMTIADVYLPNQPQGAANRVRAWAAVIRRELARG
jgi:hypothetical protein